MPFKDLSTVSEETEARLPLRAVPRSAAKDVYERDVIIESHKVEMADFYSANDWYSQRRRIILGRISRFGIKTMEGLWVDADTLERVRLMLIDLRDLRQVVAYSAHRVKDLKAQGDENAAATVAEELRLLHENEDIPGFSL